MVKDLEWLKEQVNDYLDIEGVEDARMALKAALGYIDQLDEPEFTESHLISFVCEKYGIKNRFFAKRALGIVFDNIDSKTSIGELLDKFEQSETLSQEWIDDHKRARINNLRKMTTSDFVSVDDLQGLLMPEQLDYDEVFDEGYKSGYRTAKNQSPKLDKPVIPDYVADFIKENKKTANHWFEAFDEVVDYYNGALLADEKTKAYHYIIRNIDRYVDAYRYGYTVGEKKYVVPLGELHALCKLTDDTVDIYKEDSDKLHLDDDFIFTEQEIKDYDERYFAFAVPVEGLEE